VAGRGSIDDDARTHARTHRASRLSSEPLPLLAASSSSDEAEVAMTSSGWCLIMMDVRNLRAWVMLHTRVGEIRTGEHTLCLD